MPVPATRESILVAAVPVLAAEPQLSLVALADRIGVGRTTLYRHFGDSASLRAALAEHTARQLARATERARITEGSAVEALRRLCAELFDLGDVLSLLFADDPVVSDQALTAAGSRISNAPEEANTDPLEVTLLRGQRDGVVDPELPVAWAVTFSWLTLASGHLYATNTATDRHRAFELAWRAVTRTLLV
ncbi:TetR/AcrR family transcriptional regulator [Enemella evansiae]|uniref:TetR/AcrR family transcriptional regulator n=1 Tax=Enemella evansiae TaxID=2016499 RepID=UPI000B96A34C|nr:TetR/AcrR family transcriptional regulator [Enemella evansiae]OYO04229.1 TetR family transcriptional regulator [Enemella evansiae]OYO07053.1 TetR family transcriptional regulator [Enemella evansiae]